MSKSSQKPRKATPRKKAKRLSDVIPELAVFDTEPRIAKQSTILLFDEIGAEIAVEIAAHRDRYKDAGKWLDEYCSKKEWRKRQKAALKKAEVEYAEDPTEGRANGISDLKRRIKRRRKISRQMCLSDAVDYWLERYKGYQLVTAEDGRCILLIALLLLQPNIETVADILRPFAQWAWMTDDEIDSRAWAGMPLWSGEYGDRLKALIRAALKQVRLQDQLEALKESPQDKSKAETILPIEHSLPLPMVKWAYIFGVSANKLRELRREEKYHFSKVSARLWTLPKDELPTEYLEKYRQHTSHTHLKAQ